MTSSTPDSTRPWQEWGIREWNDALFGHFFCAPEGDTVPVSRLVVNAEVLQRVTGDFQTAPKEIRACFRNAVLVRLRQTGRSLCTDATAAEWASRRGHDIPPYFAHLAVTCLAASGTGDSATPKNDFRKRLNRFLGRGDDNARYHLGKLPRLWEMVRNWLDRAADAGRPYRRLVLRPQPASVRLIGYSLDLSFPLHHEQRALVDLFHGRDLPASPPVGLVLRIVEGGLDRFGQRFQQAFREFFRAFLDGEPRLYQRPFWSAVRDAITTASQRQGPGDARQAARALLRLEREADWKFGVTIYLDRPIGPSLPHGLTVVPADDLAVGEFHFVVGHGSDGGSERSPGELLLSGSLRAPIQGLSADAVFRAVAEGILLFVPDEEDVWVATYSMPRADSIRALVRSDRAAAVLRCLGGTGAPVQSRDSRYAGWTELDGFSSHHVREAKLSLEFPEVLALQETIDAPRLVVRGGVRLPNGWLGRRAALPEFAVSPPGLSLTLESVARAGDEEAVLARAVPDQPGVFRVPEPPELPLDLDGSYLVRARVGDAVVTTRTVEFRSNVLSADYRSLKRPDDWLAEASALDCASLAEGGRTPAEVSVPLQEGAPLLSLADAKAPDQTAGVPSPEVVSLTETLAGISLRRRLIGAAELAEWFGRTLGTRGEFLWDLVRAWVEAGALDALVYRRWRCRAYVARRPRFVVSARRGAPSVFAVLQGLAPLAVEREVERAAASLGAEVERLPPASPLVPVPLVLRASSPSVVEAVSSAACIEPPERLLPIASCLDRLERVAEIRSGLRKNHRLAGYWLWEDGRFSPRRPRSEVVVEWYRREDVPDGYVVRRAGEVLWHSLSRTWALLVGASCRGGRPFLVDGPNRMRRGLPGLHLPVPLGRWATASSGRSPGPRGGHATGTDYAYFFAGPDARAQALEALWPISFPETLAARGRHLGQLLFFRGSGSEPLAAVPGWARRLFELHAAALGCGRLAHVVHVPRRLLPGLTAFAEAVRRESTSETEHTSR
jgi:hypothetical protein